MKCPHCHIDCFYYRHIFQSGTVAIVQRCPKCKRNPNPDKPYLPKKQFQPYVDLLPIYHNGINHSQPCCVTGCNNKGTELHHFAPKQFFKHDADNWPTGYLCKYHHRMWHDVMNINMSEHKRANTSR